MTAWRACVSASENNKGPLTRARLFVSGARATASTAEEARKTDCRSPCAARQYHQDRHRNGNANDMPPEVYTALIDEAHKRKLQCRGASLQSGRCEGPRERRARRHRAQHSRSGRRRGVHRRAEAPQRRLHSDAHARSVGVSVRIDAGLLQRSVLPARRCRCTRRRSSA